MSEPLKINVHVEEKRYQPTQEKTVVPDWDAKTVTPDKGYALSKVTVEGMPEPTESETFTENGTYNVGRIGTAVVDVDVDLQNKTVTPTEQTQTVEADAGYDGLDTVTVNPIPPEYVVPTGSVDITQNGPVNVAGKKTANVNVPGIIPSGTKQINITANGTTTEDVADYADAEITVNTLPEKAYTYWNFGTNGYARGFRVIGLTSIPDNFKPGGAMEELILDDGVTYVGYKAFRDYPFKSIVFPQNEMSIANEAFYHNMNLLAIELKSDITFSGTSNFYNCTELANVIFGGNVNSITSSCFASCSKVVLYDFSHCTAIPPLYSVASLGHAPGCVIRIPAVLSDTTLGEGNGWESATNWSALTNIVWEVV